MAVLVPPRFGPPAVQPAEYAPTYPSPWDSRHDTKITRGRHHPFYKVANPLLVATLLRTLAGYHIQEAAP
jgi:hypothetical protein